MRPKWCLCSLILLGGIVIAQQAAADRVIGSPQGVFSGSDTEFAIFTVLGLEVSELVRMEWPAISSNGLTISNLVLNEDNEATSGYWDYAGVGTVDLFVVKAGPNYAAYLYNDTITDDMPNLGLWDTTDLSDKGVSHITAYTIIPEPSTALLLALGLVVLLVGRRIRIS